MNIIDHWANNLRLVSLTISCIINILMSQIVKISKAILKIIDKSTKNIVAPVFFEKTNKPL